MTGLLMGGELNPTGRSNSSDRVAQRYSALWRRHRCRSLGWILSWCVDDVTLSLHPSEVCVRLWDDDELATEWTVQPSDQPLLANKTGATRIGFAALLTFFRHEGRFPAGDTRCRLPS